MHWMASMGRDSVEEVDMVDALSTFWRFADPGGPILPNREFFTIMLPVGTILDHEFSLDKAPRAQIA